MRAKHHWNKAKPHGVTG